MGSPRSGMEKRQWVVIILVAIVLALVTLLWLDVRGAGDSRLCGLDRYGVVCGTPRM